MQSEQQDLWAEIIGEMQQRRQVGLDTYGVPVTASDSVDWVTHLTEELLDGAVYARAVGQVIKDLQTLAADLQKKLDSCKAEKENLCKLAGENIASTYLAEGKVADLQKQLADRDSTIKAFWDDFKVKDQQIADLTRERDGFKQQWEECAGKSVQVEVIDGQ